MHLFIYAAMDFRQVHTLDIPEVFHSWGYIDPIKSHLHVQWHQLPKHQGLIAATTSPTKTCMKRTVNGSFAVQKFSCFFWGGGVLRRGELKILPLANFWDTILEVSGSIVFHAQKKHGSTYCDPWYPPFNRFVRIFLRSVRHDSRRCMIIMAISMCPLLRCKAQLERAPAPSHRRSFLMS